MINNFAFGTTSLGNMYQVHPYLIMVTSVSLTISEQDFMLFDGVRTEHEQRQMVGDGLSQTMNSKHLIQESGYAEAVDLVPYVRGAPRWELAAGCRVAAAVQAASSRHRVAIRWGGVWDRHLGELDPDNLVGEVAAYTERRRAKGKSAFIDAPHFQLV